MTAQTDMIKIIRKIKNREREVHMKEYMKPMLVTSDELAEGVYLASGCYTASAYIHQTPQDGRGDFL